MNNYVLGLSFFAMMVQVAFSYGMEHTSDFVHTGQRAYELWDKRKDADAYERFTTLIADLKFDQASYVAQEHQKLCKLQKNNADDNHKDAVNRHAFLSQRMLALEKYQQGFLVSGQEFGHMPVYIRNQHILVQNLLSGQIPDTSVVLEQQQRLAWLLQKELCHICFQLPYLVSRAQFYDARRKCAQDEYTRFGSFVAMADKLCQQRLQKSLCIQELVSEQREEAVAAELKAIDVKQTVPHAVCSVSIEQSQGGEQVERISEKPARDKYEYAGVPAGSDEHIITALPDIFVSPGMVKAYIYKKTLPFKFDAKPQEQSLQGPSGKSSKKKAGHKNQKKQRTITYHRDENILLQQAIDQNRQFLEKEVMDLTQRYENFLQLWRSRLHVVEGGASSTLVSMPCTKFSVVLQDSDFPKPNLPFCFKKVIVHTGYFEVKYEAIFVMYKKFIELEKKLNAHDISVRELIDKQKKGFAFTAQNFIEHALQATLKSKRFLQNFKMLCNKKNKNEMELYMLRRLQAVSASMTLVTTIQDLISPCYVLPSCITWDEFIKS